MMLILLEPSTFLRSQLRIFIHCLFAYPVIQMFSYFLDHNICDPNSVCSSNSATKNTNNVKMNHNRIVPFKSS